MKQVCALRKSYGHILAVDGVTFDIRQGEMLSPCSVLVGIGAVAFTAGVTILSRADV